MKEILIAAGLIGAAAFAALDSSPPAAAVGEQPLLPSEQAAPTDSTMASVHYTGCNEVRALGKAPLHAGQPGYRIEMDGDGDGIACEPHR